MVTETVVPGAAISSAKHAGGRRLHLATALLAAGMLTAAVTVLRPRAAATFGAAALLAGGAVAAMRGRRPGEAPPPGPAPDGPMLRAARGALAAGDPQAGLRTLLDALAAALGAGAAIQAASPGAGAIPTALALPGATGERAPGDLAEGTGGLVPESMRTAEPCALSGGAAAGAGGLPGVLAAGAALSVPVRLQKGELTGWLVAARAGPEARPFTAEEIALAESAAAVSAAVLLQDRLRREAQAGLQARSDFLAVMSHELKTPLNVVVGYADLLLMGLPEAVPEGAHRNLERLRRSARELQDRIDEILAYARVADGMEVPDEEPVEVDAAAVLREVAAQLEPLARARGLRYAIRAPAAAVPVRTYPEALTRLLRQVVSNAVKFTYEGGVEAELTAVPGGAAIRVADTGIGMPPEQVARAFEPFWQAQRGATRREGGLGLGLATARALARALGGEIRLESVPGTGTTVTITLGRPG